MAKQAVIARPAEGSRHRFRLVWLAGVLSLLAFALAASLSFALLYSPPEPSDKYLEAIRARGALVVGTDATYPPFSYLDDAGYNGFDVQLAQRLAERLGVGVEFVSISYDGLYDAIRAGRVDIVVSAVAPIPELGEDFSYSVPYLNAGQVMVVRASETRVKSVDDLSGLTVGVELGSLADVEARRLQGATEDVTLRSSYHWPPEALRALRRGEVDVVITDLVSALSFAQRDGGVRILERPVTVEPYVVVMPPNAPYLLAETDKAIRDMRASGELARLAQQWFR